MTTPGYFEVYAQARPALPAGSYTATSSQVLLAAPPAPQSGTVTVPVPDTEFHLDIVGPRYVMPPEQVLSTFPPATSQGDWRERLPQIVLKRRTLPWERNPTPDQDPETAPPWLALVVLADGEGQLSADIDVAQCVTPGVTLDDDADVPRGKYLEVSQDVINDVFPCLDELELLCHVRNVDLSDTELALGDDDGYLAVVLSNRLPQPAAPATGDTDATPLKYTAYLINLEKQLDALRPTEPKPLFSFNALAAMTLVQPELLTPAPNATLDQLAMGLGEASYSLAKDADGEEKALTTVDQVALAPYATSHGLEAAAASWATGPTRAGARSSNDLDLARGYKAGINDGLLITIEKSFRFPVLVSWDFTCTGSGGFERLMNELDVGLLGTVDAQSDANSSLQVAATGHVAMAHRTRQGDANTAWYRGPLGPQPTSRVAATDGVLPLASVSDQLRKVVPDGTEDLSLAALFEIGRLLTLSKPALIASLMSWRADLFGAARAREIAAALTGSVIAEVGIAAAGSRNSIEALLRTKIVGALTAAAPGALAPSARSVTKARFPNDLVQLSPDAVLAGLGADLETVASLGQTYGVAGLASVPVTVGQASTASVITDTEALANLSERLTARVNDLVVGALKVDPTTVRTDLAGKAASRLKRSRRKDALDRLIEDAETRRTAGSRPEEG